MSSVTSENELGLVKRAKLRLSRFRTEENGGAIIFTLFLIVMMLILGGYAVDTMRYENKRARLQATLDRAVLAAAALDQRLEPEAVVRDYFDKAGLLDEVTNIRVTQSLNGRTVEATAALDVHTMFMQGIDTLVAPASGAATETISDVEIVLVLDVSGSMRSNSKINNLRTAAMEFVSTIRQNDTDNRISIAVVPFNAQVNLGPTLFNAYANITDEHGITNSHCIDLPASAFSGPGISPLLVAPQSGFFDAASTTTMNTSYVAPQAGVFSTTTSVNDSVPTCKVFTNNFVRLPAQNINTLRSQINALTGDGNTSITLGMKWGMALIDPGSRPLFNTFIAAGQMPATLVGRPYDYDREDTMKVIVLMTDGEHVSSTFLNSGYRVGLSPIYRGADGKYAIYLPQYTGSTTKKYYTPHNNTWNTLPTWSGSGTVTQLTWPQVWSSVRMQWVAWQLYARPLGGSNSSLRTSTYNTWMNNFRGSTVVSTMNSQLQTSCAQARANGVVIFGIAFEAPTNGQTQIAGCASSASHYFDSDGLEIVTDFQSIASQINALRLIQ